MPFRTVSFSEQDYDEVQKFASELSRELGTKLSMAQVLMLAKKFYEQRRKFVEEENEA